MAETTASGLSRKQMILFLAVPISVLVLAIGFLVVSNKLAQPSYNFLFSICPSYSCNNEFTINSAGSISESSRRDFMFDRAQLYLYDVGSDSYRPLTLEEAQSLDLDPSSVAPDGYRVEYENKDLGGFFFGSGTDNGWVIKKDFRARDLVVPNRYEREIKFLAWEVS